MPLYLDKLLTQLAYPLMLSIVLIVAGLLLWALKKRRTAAGLIITATAWLTLWSLPVFSDAIRSSLESRYEPRRVEALPEADAIVLLGGGVESSPSAWPYPDMGKGSDRIWHAARLYHAGKAPFIIISGGDYGWLGDRKSNATVSAGLLEELGVPHAALIEESESRNTRENAVETATVAEREGFQTVLLVTSVLHMRRAEATFLKTDLTVIPAPTDFEVKPQSAHLLRWLPDAEALYDGSRAIKEYLGYWVYRSRGWVAALGKP